MMNDQIQMLLDRAGTPPTDADVVTLRRFLQRSGLTNDEQRVVFDFLTRPALRLNWAQPPEAGHDCVQMIEVRLPAAFRGLQPRLHVRFPQTLPAQQLPGTDVKGTGDLLGVVDAGRLHWRLLPLQHNAAPDDVWRADLQFRLPDRLQGAYLWEFRIDFLNSWGHTDLHRWFSANCMAIIGNDRQGETTLEIEAGDFSIVTMPDLEKWKNVRIKAAGNANLRQAAALPDHAAMFQGTSQQKAAAAHGVVIDPAINRAGLPKSRRTIVVTPHIPPLPPFGSIRGSWPEVLTAKLTMKPGGDAAASRTLLLHTSAELHLGRSPEYQDNHGRTHINDIVTDFEKQDFPNLSKDELWTRRAVVSSANTTLLIDNGTLTVRNTGKPGSKFSGYTEVSWSEGGDSTKEILDTRDQEFQFDVRKRRITDLRLQCGGSPAAVPSLPGYLLDLTPVKAWDDTSSLTWESPDDLAEQIGELPRLARAVTAHGMDALLITPRPPQLLPASQPPRLRHVLLLRQLWLGFDGLPIDNTTEARPREVAAVRLLIARRDEGKGRVVLLQLLSDRFELWVHSAPDGVGMQVPPGGIIPLQNQDRLTLKRPDGLICWEGDFEVLRP